jgi:hypothetical protein
MLLGGAPIQPYIHDCKVNLHISGQTYTYRIFYKRHNWLARNHCIFSKTLCTFKGELIVMLVDATGKVRAMRAGDSKRADLLIKSWVTSSDHNLYSLLTMIWLGSSQSCHRIIAIIILERWPSHFAPNEDCRQDAAELNVPFRFYYIPCNSTPLRCIWSTHFKLI